MIEIPRICRYCGNPVVFTSNAEVYGKEYGNGKCYLCRNCGAYVGVHTGTCTPLGTMANDNLRMWRKFAHTEFDRLWKGPDRVTTRGNAYSKLAESLGLRKCDTHIALFEMEQCQQTIAFARGFLHMYSNVTEG